MREIRAAGYTRVGTSLSVEEQERAIKSFCKRSRFKLAFYTDSYVQVHGRPWITRRAITDIIDFPRVFDIVVAVDRATLQHPDIPQDICEAIIARKKKILIVGEEFDRDSLLPPESKRARNRSPLAVRLLNGRRDQAMAGHHTSGPAPYGYKRENSRLVPEPSEMDIVKLIYRTYLRRRSMKNVMDYLNNRGQTTRRGRPWSRAGISWILKNRTYLGRVHFKEIDRPGSHEPLIAQIIFNKVQVLIGKNNKRRGKGSGKEKAKKTIRVGKAPA